MNKQIGRNFISNVIAFVTNFCISFFLTPFIIRTIGVEANGFVTLANNFVEYAQLFTVALNSMAGHFITIKVQQKQITQANKYFTSLTFANIILSVVFTVIFSIIILFLDRFLSISPGSVNDIKVLWAFVVLSFIINLATSSYWVSTFVSDRLDKSALCTARGTVLRAVTLVLLYSFLRPHTFYMGIATLVSGLNVLISHVYFKHKLTPQLRVRREYFDFGCIKELVSSGIWNSVSKLSTILSSGLDLLVSNIFVGGVAMGVLNLSKIPSNIIITLFTSITSIFVPQLTIAYAKKDHDDLKKQLFFSIKLMCLFSSIPIAILVGFGKTFYGLWVPSQDSELLTLLAVIACFSLVFALPMEPVYNIFTVKNKIKVPSLVLICFSVVSLLTVFIGLRFFHSENAKIIYLACVGAIFNTIRVLTFLPVYASRCINSTASAFYSMILRNVLSVAILIAITFLLNAMFDINSWIKLFAACFVIDILVVVYTAFVLRKPSMEES